MMLMTASRLQTNLIAKPSANNAPCLFILITWVVHRHFAGRQINQVAARQLGDREDTKG